MRAFVLAVALFAASWSAQALDIPRGSAADARVKRIAYNEHDVVALYSYSGAATQVVLAPGEKVLDIASGFGDGWEVLDRRNVIYIKPRSVGEDENRIEPTPGEWDTNLIVETDQRSYLFQLFLIGSPSGSTKLEYDPRVAYRIQFSYPQVEAARAKAGEIKRETDSRLAAGNPVKNLNYTMKVGRSSAAIAPSSAYDDGRFTYFTFAANREIPTVFLVGEDKSESIVNTHMSGDTLVVQRVAPRMVLRLGKQAVSIFNESYDDVGVAADTGTTVPGVSRLVTVPQHGDAPSPTPMETLAQNAIEVARSMPAPGGATPYSPSGTNPPAQAPSAAPPPAPTFVGLANAPVQATLRTWLPADWRLAWDTKADPRGAAIESHGDFLQAVRELFATRKNWTAPLEAQAFPNEKILQVRDPVTPPPPQLTVTAGAALAPTTNLQD